MLLYRPQCPHTLRKNPLLRWHPRRYRTVSGTSTFLQKPTGVGEEVSMGAAKATGISVFRTRGARARIEFVATVAGFSYALHAGLKEAVQVRTAEATKHTIAAHSHTHIVTRRSTLE